MIRRRWQLIAINGGGLGLNMLTDASLPARTANLRGMADEFSRLTLLLPVSKIRSGGISSRR
jgi:hypothetical protein